MCLPLNLLNPQVQAEQYLFALVLHAIRTRIEGSGRGLLCNGAGANGSGSAWGSAVGRGGPTACSRCGGAADPACQICHGTGVSLAELGFDVDNGDKKAKTKSKKKRERKARAKAAKKSQGRENGAAGAGEGIGSNNGGSAGCNGRGDEGRGEGAKSGGAARNHVARHTNTTSGFKALTLQQQKRPKTKAGNSTVGVTGEGDGGSSTEAGRPRGSSGHKGGQGAGGVGATGTSAARARAGSSGMDSAGSLLSMLAGGDGCGGGMDEDEDDSGDEGIDEDLIREMERLRILKAQSDVQRTRAALRSNLQRNFDQLLVSSVKDAAGTGGGSNRR